MEIASTVGSKQPGARRASRPDIASRIARLVAFNEVLAIADHLHPDGGRPTFLCECGNTSCRAVIRLPLSEYERIRRHDRLLRVVGHDRRT